VIHRYDSATAIGDQAAAGSDWADIGTKQTPLVRGHAVDKCSSVQQGD